MHGARWQSVSLADTSRWGAQQTQQVARWALPVIRYLHKARLGPVKGRKCHLSTTPGEWGSVGVRATCSVPVSGACPLGAVQSCWFLQGWLCSPSPLLAWPIPSKYSCFPSRQWSQPILWSFSLPHIFTRLKISSCISQVGNVRCS